MKITKRLACGLFSFQIALGAMTGTAQAHSGAGAIILLPFYIANEAVDYVYLNTKIFGKGFTVNSITADSDSANKIELTHKKSKIIYNFFKVSLDGKLDKLCANRGRLATPEEVLALHSIRSLERVSAFISKPDEKDYVFGFAEGEKNYFKMNVKSKKVERYSLEASKDDAPLICVETVAQREAEKKEKARWSNYTNNSKYCLDTDGTPLEKAARTVRCDDFEQLSSILKKNPSIINTKIENKSLLELALDTSIYLDQDYLQKMGDKTVRNQAKVQNVLVKNGADLNQKIMTPTYEGDVVLPIVFKLSAENMQDVDFSKLTAETINLGLLDKFSRIPYNNIRFLTSILSRSDVQELNTNRKKYIQNFTWLNSRNVMYHDSVSAVESSLETVKYLVTNHKADFTARVSDQDNKTYPMYVQILNNFNLTRIQYSSNQEGKDLGVAKIKIFGFMMEVLNFNIFDEAANTPNLDEWKVKEIRKIQTYVEENL